MNNVFDLIVIVIVIYFNIFLKVLHFFMSYLKKNVNQNQNRNRNRNRNHNSNIILIHQLLFFLRMKKVMMIVVVVEC